MAATAYRPVHAYLLGEDYIIDFEVTVKPALWAPGGCCRHLQFQEACSSVARTHLNPGGLRLVLGVEATPGNGHTGTHPAPALWSLLERLPRDCRPTLLRGDSGIASEGMMCEAEGGGSGATNCALPASHGARVTPHHQTDRLQA
jgi:hypothetical protein